MSVKITISYNTDEELSEVLQLLSPVLEKYKISKNNTGQYKKAYAMLKKVCTHKKVCVPFPKRNE